MKKTSSSGAGLMGLFRWMHLSANEMHIYRMLSKTPMTIRQLIKATRLSERMLRTHLDSLINKNFVYKEPLLEKRMKYVYHGNPEDTIADMLVKRLDEFRQSRRSKGKMLKTRGVRNE